MSRRLLIRNAVVLSLAFASAASVSAQMNPPQTIRIWGHGHRGQDYIQTLLTAWQDGYKKLHPDVKFEDHLYGNASGIGSLFTHVADLAILDREASFIEVDAYQQGTGHDPFAVPVAQGSVATPHHAPALVVYVNPANPLTRLTMQQIDAIFDADHRSGDRAFKTWGDLGLTGEMASHPIQLYMQNLQSAEVQFFERAALKGSQKFSCCLTLFAGKPGLSAGRQISAALAKDKYGLAITATPAPGLKPVPLAASADGQAVFANAESISAGTYPLARTVYIYANRRPKESAPQNVAAFLAYIVSPEGQNIIARTGGYLPLSPVLVAKARESLR